MITLNLRELPPLQVSCGRFSLQTDLLYWTLWQYLPADDGSYTSFGVLCFSLDVYHE